MKKEILLGLIGVAVVCLAAFLFWPEKKGTEGVPSFVAQTNVAEVVDVDNLSSEEKADKPAFDIVRVETDGSMVAAGKGLPGSKVELMDGEEVLASLDTDERGEWVLIPSDPLPSGIHEMWLRDSSNNSREESEVVVVNVPEGKDRKDTIAVLLSSDSEDVKVLQGPTHTAKTMIEIQSANYANKNFIVKGSATEPGRINVYADNIFLGAAYAKQPGEWMLKVPRTLTAGQKYMIRADKLDSKGKVTARIEVPFTLEAGIDAAKKRRIRIIKGDNLWTIAKHVYGTGFAYVTIYQANRHQIKDPDLIYPNQVFVLPQQLQK